MFAGLGASKLGTLRSAGTGAEVFSGAGVSHLGKFVSSGSGEIQVVFIGSGASNLGPLSSSGSGTVVNIEVEHGDAGGVEDQSTLDLVSGLTPDQIQLVQMIEANARLIQQLESRMRPAPSTRPLPTHHPPPAAPINLQPPPPRVTPLDRVASLLAAKMAARGRR